MICNGRIIELNRNGAYPLLYGLEVLDIKQIMVTADPETADLYIIGMEKQAQLQPCQRGECQNLRLFLTLGWERESPLGSNRWDWNCVVVHS
jgi:hypothetical protein